MSEFRTHEYHTIAGNFETNPMGAVPGSETQMVQGKNMVYISFRFLGRGEWVYENRDGIRELVGNI